MSSTPTETGQQAGFLPFAGVLPAAGASDTSRSAAEQMRPVARSLRETVLRWFITRGTDGGTDEECQLGLGLKAQTQGPRRGELCRLGLLIDSGRRRRTSSGRQAIVWVRNVLSCPEGTR